MIKLKIADLFTLGNLAAGFSAILTQDVRLAAGLIVLGACLDVLDGLVARAMNQQSELGKQLDSLADMVTFGVAPAVLFFHLLPAGQVTTIVCTLIPVFSAWRLAQFNLLPSQPHFIGLPTPANALWYVGLALWVPELPAVFTSWPITPVLMALALALALLMVSPIRFPAIKSIQHIRRDAPVLLTGLVGVLIPLISGHPELAINGFLLGLILASITAWLFGRKV